MGTKYGEQSGEVREVRDFAGALRRLPRERLLKWIRRNCGEVGFGHLEGEEEEVGAFGVECVVGESADDFGEGDLEVFWIGDGRNRERCASRGAGGRAARGVVVEAELLAAEGG